MPVPAPRARYEVRACLRRVFTAATDLRHSNEHPVTPFLAPENVVRVNPFQARTCVRGNPVCGAIQCAGKMCRGHLWVGAKIKSQKPV